MHKCGLIEPLFQRSFRLCSSYKNLHDKIETLKSIFKHNNYPKNFVNQCIKKFLNKLLNKFKLLLKEGLLIKRDKPILNRTIKSFPLELFD